MKYYKFILRVSHTSTNVAILAECGIHNILYHCSSLVLNYLYRIMSSDTPILIQKTLELSPQMSFWGHNTWFHRVKEMFTDLGFNLDLTFPCLEATLQQLGDQSLQRTSSVINNDQGLTQSGGNRLRTYRLFKVDAQVTEQYLTTITNPKIRQAYTKFRTSDHKVMIKMWQHCKPPKPVHERTCPICTTDSIEDEIHFLVDCPFTLTCDPRILHLPLDIVTISIPCVQKTNLYFSCLVIITQLTIKLPISFIKPCS